MNKKISVIIPVYNTGSPLRENIKNWVNQSYTDIEILLIDDGSKPETADLCDELSDGCSVIKTIHKTNGGVSSARNVGISHATGDYIVFADSDDNASIDLCENMLQRMEKTNADIVVASYFTVFNGSVKAHRLSERVYHGCSEMASDFPDLYMDCFLNSPWNKMFRKNMIKIPFREDMRYFEDYYFCLDYLDNCGTIATLDTPLYYYVENMEGSLTKQYRDDLLENFKKIYFRQLSFAHKYFGEQFDDYFKASLYYGVYNSSQKAVYYPELDKKQKKDILKSWVGDDVVRKSISPSVRVHIKKMCSMQQRLGNKMIINNHPIQLYYFLNLKKTLNPILTKIKKYMIKCRQSEKN